MDEKDFALLHTLRECGNITHAADRLYLTQSALSKRIKAIERELGCEVIIRTRKGVRFTPEGELVIERTARAQRELTALRHELSQAQGEICGTLRAGFSVNYSINHLPELIAEYHRLYPRVQLEIATDLSRNLHTRLQRGDLDLAVLRGDMPWDGARIPLSLDRICVVRAHEHANTPLSELTYINHAADLSHTARIVRWLHENNLANDANRISVTDLNTCLELVKRGIGWALLPEIILEGFDGRIEPCTFANGEPFVRRMHIDCQKECECLPQAQALIELVQNRYEQVKSAVDSIVSA